MYLKSWYFRSKRTEKGIRKAIQYSEEAIKLDQSFALAYAELAACYNSLMLYNIIPGRESLPLAKQTANRALELDNKLAEAYGVLGIIDFYSWNWSIAKKDFEQGLTYNPNSTQTLFWYSLFLMVQGYLDEALIAARQAQKLDPLAPLIYTQIARVLMLSHQFDEAIENCYQAIELDETFPWSHGLMGMIHCIRGAYDESASELKKCGGLAEDPEAEGLLGYVYGVSGQTSEALGQLRKLCRRSKEKYIPSYAILFIHIGLGEKERAFELLESMYNERSYFLVGLKVLPVFDSMRSDPRFVDLTRRVGLLK